MFCIWGALSFSSKRWRPARSQGSVGIQSSFGEVFNFWCPKFPPPLLCSSWPPWGILLSFSISFSLSLTLRFSQMSLWWGNSISADCVSIAWIWGRDKSTQLPGSGAMNAIVCCSLFSISFIRAVSLCNYFVYPSLNAKIMIRLDLQFSWKLPCCACVRDCWCSELNFSVSLTDCLDASLSAWPLGGCSESDTF